MGYYGDYGYSTYDSSTAVFSILAGLGTFMLPLVVISILIIVSMWIIFKKAGKPGWAAIVPFYNMYVMCEIAEKEWWYLLLLFVPIAQIYAGFVIYDGIAKKFGKTTGFTIGMIFLPIIFLPILAFSKNAVYLDRGYFQSTSYNNPSHVPQMPVNNASVNETVMQNSFDNSFGMNEATVQNTGAANGMDFNNNANNFGPQMPVNEPVMQNSFDNSFTMNETTVQNTGVANGMDFNNNANNFGPQMSINEPVMQNSFDNSFAMNEATAQNTGAANGMDFNNNANNFGPQMPVNEPVMQNSFDNSFAMNETQNMNSSSLNFTSFNSNMNNLSSKMPTDESVRPMNFNTGFNNTQSNPNDIFNNPNGNM